ncbi:MAG: Antitoxin component of bacterial toxin-antitoxin system, MqsA, partial [Thermomicrobiales bacterium]|nr:Antitoxin component of bacterial toxin-antitoxin system, MqsA [Thermomicrobiales bacterium]
MNDTPDADLPARLRHLRQTLGLTQTALARRLGVSNVTVNRWEHGRTVPGPAARARLQRIAATPPSGDALHGTGSPATPPLPATALVGRREEV